MPDILIHMDMPQHCFNCSTKIDPDNRRCNIDGHIFEETLSKLTCRRDDDCPLHELPPHGDLILKDDAIVAVKLLSDLYPEYRKILAVLWDQIKDLTVIIPEIEETTNDPKT